MSGKTYIVILLIATLICVLAFLMSIVGYEKGQGCLAIGGVLEVRDTTALYCRVGGIFLRIKTGQQYFPRQDIVG
jgi:hypothetical protein